ncbi:hypothetical protein HDU67_009182 [Dinochytrium kinnereticum]|nr:hypothetical protein HDU67_009182 [Dinochytrium kinnereticum]
MSGPPVSKMLNSNHLKNASTDELVSFMNFLKTGASGPLHYFGSLEGEGPCISSQPQKGIEDMHPSRRNSCYSDSHHTSDQTDMSQQGHRSTTPTSRDISYVTARSLKVAPALPSHVNVQNDINDWQDFHHHPHAQQLLRQPPTEAFNRIEIEATLHKTLELDYLLTVKELKSYENLAETAGMEYVRALAAFEDAEKFALEKRRELQAALQDRSEIYSIIRYLTARVESLDVRVKDGNQRLVRMGLDASGGMNKAVANAEGCRQHQHPHHQTLHQQETESIPSPQVFHDHPSPSFSGPPSSRRDSEINNQFGHSVQAPDHAVFEYGLPPGIADPAIHKRARTTSPVTDDAKSFPERYSSLSMAPSEITDISPPAAPTMAVAVPSPAACIFYQGGQCNGSVCGMKSPHTCIRCHENHPAILCKKDRNVCVKWNMDAWNSAGTCRIVDCRRHHECIRCGTSHPAIICPENLDNYLMEYLAKCRLEGHHPDDLGQMEMLITRRSAITAATGNSLQPPVGAPTPLPPGSMARNNVVQPHPLHLAAAASMAASGKDEAGGSGLILPLANAPHGYAVGGMAGGPMLLVDPERASKRVRADDAHAILTGFRTSHGSLLTDSERRMICRDYNNFKCDVDDSRCRFKHACLRCGLTDHRERNCLVTEAA